MNIKEVLKKEESIFVIDNIEDKKIITMINLINKQLAEVLQRYEELQAYTTSQLKGEVNKKIVMAKSLKEVYSNWASVTTANANLQKEETDYINKFNSARNQVISNLQILLKEVHKFPVVCAYDVYDGVFVKAREDHIIIVWGKNNSAIIETIIEQLNSCFKIKVHFEEIEPVELEVNYTNVDRNVNECKKGIEEFFADKPTKGDKILVMVNAMEEIARKLVLFATYKEDLLNIGCAKKDVDLKEKEMLKKYVPLKKQLTKLLRVEFVDVCNIAANENDFPTQEFKVIDDDDDLYF